MPEVKTIQLADLIEAQVLTREMADFLVQAVRTPATVLFSGEAGSGKTALLKAVMEAAFDESTEILVVESHPEVAGSFPKAHVALPESAMDQLNDAPVVALGEIYGEMMPVWVAMNDLPQRILLGTIHLRKPESVEDRLHWLLESMREVGRAMPRPDLIVHLARNNRGARYVEQIIRVLDNGGFEMVFDGRRPRLGPIDETQKGGHVVKSEKARPDWLIPDDHSLLLGTQGKGHATDEIKPLNGDRRLP